MKGAYRYSDEEDSDRSPYLAEFYFRYSSSVLAPVLEPPKADIASAPSKRL
jgi:hypothetical protein